MASIALSNHPCETWKLLHRPAILMPRKKQQNRFYSSVEDPYIEFERTYEAVEVKIGHRRPQLKARDRWSQDNAIPTERGRLLDPIALRRMASEA